MVERGIFVLLVCLLVVSVYISGVVALSPLGLKECVGGCEWDYDVGEERSKCVAGCEANYGFEDGGELECLPCGDSCVPYDVGVRADCLPPSNGEPECGVDSEGKCVVLGFQTDWDGTCGDFDCDELKIVDGGVAPDSIFYFIDELFDGFGDDIKVKEEKVAEIKSMIEAGDFDSARKALMKYKERAEELEQEIAPERVEDAKKSEETIKKVLREIEDQIPEDDKKEFIDDIVDSEAKIRISAEIASKIRELCGQLSKIDPLEYSRVCSSRGDSPKWQKELDEKLTDEQREEAKKFGQIMSECFKTAGQECKCEEIPFTEFAEMCSIAAPLATACEIDGDEDACEKIDNLEMPELPPHLQSVFDKLEGDISGAQFDLHMPRECREAGATSPKECMKVMIQTHAPEECRDELISRNVQNEREAREICEEIMFNLNAPEECIEAGIRDGKECGKFMFRQNAPEECVEAGLTGENRNDHRKCEEIMQGLGGDRRGPQGGFGGNCREIQNPEERLKCYDGVISGVGEFREGYEGRFKENMEKQRQCADQCRSENKAWDFSNGQCVCREGGKFERREEFRSFDDERPPFDCSVVRCADGQVCSPYRGCLSPEERERELEENSNNNYPPGPGDKGYVDNTAKYDCSKLDCGPSPNYCDPWGGCIKGEGGFNPDGSSCNEGYEWDGSRCIPFGTGDYGFDDPGSDSYSTDYDSPPEESPPESSPITGGVIMNPFLDYYYYG